MSKKCTIKDVAALAGVSVGTVSMILNGSDKITEKTKERVMDAIEKLDYRRNPHARSLGSQKSRTIGLVVTDLTNPFFGMIVNSIQKYVHARDYNLLLGMSNNDIEKEAKVVSRFIDSAADGVIIVPAHDKRPDTSHIYKLIQFGIPYVYLTTRHTSIPGDCVMTDLAEGSYQMTNYLLSNGHKNPVMVCGHKDLVLSSERIRGFTRACEEHGLSVSSDQIVECEPDFCGGRDALDRILQTGKPDAILTVNDIVAMGIMKRAEELNLRIPEDLSISGYDDLLYSSMLETPLTTIRQPVAEMCELAVDLLFRRLEGEQTQNQTLRLPPTLCIRASTRKQP